jgi:hypothetical protein
LRDADSAFEMFSLAPFFFFGALGDEHLGVPSLERSSCSVMIRNSASSDGDSTTPLGIPKRMTGMFEFMGGCTWYSRVVSSSSSSALRRVYCWYRHSDDPSRVDVLSPDGGVTSCGVYALGKILP